jgi:TrmH family RNA methyltransferase
MKFISSRDNPFFKTLRKLSESARHRREAGKTLLDGWHLLQAYRQAGGEPEALILSQSAAEGEEAGALQGEVIVLPDALFAELSPVKTPTGILALIAYPFSTAEKTPQFCVLLEDIQDPGNLGAILRSAAAAGCDTAFLSPSCADAWSPKVLRAGMGAHFVLGIREKADLAATAADFPGMVLAASLAADHNLYSLDLTGALAVIVGNEGAGISDALLAVASHRVKIPMPGAVESLNAAAAAAVCLFERVRQRGVLK